MDRRIGPVRAIAGRGLEGDRYEARVGAYSVGDRPINPSKPPRISDDWRQISFIASRAIVRANRLLREGGHTPITPRETRRNVLLDMSEEDLNALKGQRFRIGEVEFEGVELCDPCRRPPTLLRRPKDGEAFEEAFENRGGLRARIITDGVIRAGDTLTILAD